MKQTFKILFITDIHLSFQNVEKLQKWHKFNMINFDICLIGGDSANCDQNNKSHNQQQQQEQTNKILRQIQQIFGCQMYFIPGNHDPLRYSEPGHKISQNIKSCNQKTIEIVQGIQLTSFGGSVPGYTDIQMTQMKWEGYPYKSNQQLAQQCLQKKVFLQKQQQSQCQKIYLTHCGPFDSETSIDKKYPPQIIYAGAVFFNTLLKHQNIILYLHGHVHNGTQFVKINQIPVINPGGLTNGRFGYVTLHRNGKGSKWVYESTQFVCLQKDNND